MRSSIATTEQRYNGHIRQFNRWNAGAPITSDRIAEYFVSVRGELSASTLRGRKSALKKSIQLTFGRAGLDQSWRIRLDAVFNEIKIPSSRAYLNPESILSSSDVRLLADAMPRKLSLILRALYASGFRITELLAIRLRDCRLPPATRRRGDPARVMVRVVGKGMKERKIPAFREKLFNEIVKEFEPAGRSVYLFYNDNPRSKTGRFSRQYVWRELNRFAIDVLQRRIHPHLLRHSHASALLSSGVVIDAVADRLGHSDRGTTANYYAHTGISSKQLDSAEV